MGGLLAGVSVVEAANYLSAPFAAMMLADLGADVLKVEPPTGDPYRRVGRPRTAIGPLFASVNRGKRSLVLDLKVEEDRERLRDALVHADVFITNWRPDVAARLGVCDADLAEANARLIRLYVTGHGTSGPLAGVPTYDSIIQARSGLTMAQSLDGRPVFTPGYPIDKMSGMFAAQAVLAALIHRANTGEGQRVDLAMLDVSAYVNFPDLFANRVFVEHQPADGRNLQAALVRAIRARDGWLVVTPVTSAEVRRACSAVGRPELATEALGWRDAAAMLNALLDGLELETSTRTVAECIAAFEAHDVAAAPCLDIDSHLVDEQVRHNDVYRIEEFPDLGPTRLVRYPASFEKAPSSYGNGRAPLLAEYGKG
jgi:formyl-CoA transferase